ncbi:MAG: four-carbon acid sugar kinase family protein [Proteobacteria bacterium]|nr:four-carbon acid sugar kinase family protein [Pseudomonadota bacterium]
MTKPVLGCIADDFTGATDLANNLVRAGMRVVQTIGVPGTALGEDADAVVVALKSRTIPAADAVAQSVAALRWLQAQGARQIYFKYCSTFDSTPAGNIGPVTDALMDALDTDFTIACPAFPENGRTVFKGYLFVGGELLQESGMRNHPLTPMTDSNLVRVLQSQTRRKVGLIDHLTVAAGPEAITARISALRASGVSMAIVDSTSNADLITMGPALKALPLVTAGSGVAIGLPPNFGLQPDSRTARLPAAKGRRAIVSGSCSTATNAQVADFICRGHPAFAVEPLALAAGTDVVGSALDWARQRDGDGAILIYATAEPDAVRQVQDQLGVARAGELVEHALAAIAAGLVGAGVRQLIVAGGETSGACVQALGVETMRIGPQIAPGVPWCFASSPLPAEHGVHLALKSGNFGGPDFFTGAFAALE